jgi:hypothetical protein
MCTNPAYGDISCTSDKTTHGYWNKDDAGSLGGGAEYSRDQTKQFRDQGKYTWEVVRYDGTTPTKVVFNETTKKDETLPMQFGPEWYGELGQSQSQLKKGDRIYVRREIKNRHQMAFYLAIEHTKLEIARLYAQAGSTMVGSATIPQQGAVRLSDVFKMDATELATKRIGYTDLASKQ